VRELYADNATLYEPETVVSGHHVHADRRGGQPSRTRFRAVAGRSC
jgi:hypothetical protein